MGACVEDWDDEMQVEEPPTPAVRKPPKAAAKDKAAAKKDSLCFICPAKKKANCRFCNEHEKQAAVIRYQAANATPPETQAVEEVLHDETKARLAIEEFQKNNPPGKYRKSKIDFGQWKKQYGIRVKRQIHENETLMDQADWYDHCEKKHKTPEWAKAEWDRMLSSNQDREGTHPDVKFWITMNATRQRTKETYIDSQYEEGFRQIKDPTAKDRSLMHDWVQQSQPSFGDSFLRNGFGASSSTSASSAQPEPEEDAKQVEKKVKKVDVSQAAPKQYEKLSRVLPKLREKAQVVLRDGAEKLKLLENHSSALDSAGVSYQQVCAVRLRLLKFWDASDTDALDQIDRVDIPPAATPAVATPQVATPPVATKAEDPKTPQGKKPPGASESNTSPAGTTPTGGSSHVAADLGKDSMSAASESPNMSPGLQTRSSLSCNAVAPSAKMGVKITSRLQKELKDAGLRAATIGVPDTWRSFCDMEDILQSILHSETADSLSQFTMDFNLSSVACGQFLDGCKKAVASVSSHIKYHDKKQEQLEALKRKEEESQAILSAKRDAKNAAEAIKQEAVQLKPLFKIAVDDSLLQSLTPVAKHTGMQKDLSPDAPFVLENVAQVTTTFSKPAVQVAMASYAGSYKKNDGFKEDRRHHAAVFKCAGKADIDDLLSSFAQVVGPDHCVATVPKVVAGVLDNSWFYGYAHDMTYTAQSPNGLGMYKLLTTGEVRWFLFETESLVAAVKKLKNVQGDQELSLEVVKAFINDADAARIASLKNENVTMMTHLQGAATVMYVPAGWIAAEKVTKGQLIYGLRKTVLYKSAKMLSNYECLTSLMAANGNRVDKMRELHAALA